MIRPATLVLALIAWFLPTFGQHALSTRDYFYVGGKYTGPPANQVMAGQMYVEVLRPRQVVQKYPLGGCPSIVQSRGSKRNRTGT
jgi:hypothetical protein